MRPIDADLLHKKIFPYSSLLDTKTYTINAKAVENAIQTSPTVDAVAVVRCKDCRWCLVENWDGEMLFGCDCSAGLNDVEPYGFCSYGERREQ